MEGEDGAGVEACCEGDAVGVGGGLFDRCCLLACRVELGCFGAVVENHVNRTVCLLIYSVVVVL